MSLRSEFERAERMLQRALAAEARLAAVEVECDAVMLSPDTTVEKIARILRAARGEVDRPAHVIAPNGWCSTCGAYTCGEGDRV